MYENACNGLHKMFLNFYKIYFNHKILVLGVTVRSFGSKYYTIVSLTHRIVLMNIELTSITQRVWNKHQLVFITPVNQFKGLKNSVNGSAFTHLTIKRRKHGKTNLNFLVFLWYFWEGFIGITKST